MLTLTDNIFSVKLLYFDLWHTAFRQSLSSGWALDYKIVHKCEIESATIDWQQNSHTAVAFIDIRKKINGDIFSSPQTNIAAIDCSKRRNSILNSRIYTYALISSRWPKICCKCCYYSLAVTLQCHLQWFSVKEIPCLNHMSSRAVCMRRCECLCARQLLIVELNSKTDYVLTLRK